MPTPFALVARSRRPMRLCTEGGEPTDQRAPCRLQRHCAHREHVARPRRVRGSLLSSLLLSSVLSSGLFLHLEHKMQEVLLQAFHFSRPQRSLRASNARDWNSPSTHHMHLGANHNPILSRTTFYNRYTLSHHEQTQRTHASQDQTKPILSHTHLPRLASSVSPGTEHQQQRMHPGIKLTNPPPPPHRLPSPHLICLPREHQPLTPAATAPTPLATTTIGRGRRWRPRRSALPRASWSRATSPPRGLWTTSWASALSWTPAATPRVRWRSWCLNSCLGCLLRACAMVMTAVIEARSYI